MIGTTWSRSLLSDSPFFTHFSSPVQPMLRITHHPTTLSHDSSLACLWIAKNFNERVHDFGKNREGEMESSGNCEGPGLLGREWMNEAAGSRCGRDGVTKRKKGVRSRSRRRSCGAS
ncbi:hypothetical protein L1887_02269 [Cichorium endivia]|nr:hypothetical protein L1887_02269 [Cichorium endivia]